MLKDIMQFAYKLSFVRAEWGFSADFSSYSSNSRGVMTLINTNYERIVEKVKTDKNGNYLLNEIIKQGKELTLANVYGRNQDNQQFYTTKL